MKALKWCANGDGRPVSPPSLVICRECQDEIGRRLKWWADGNRGLPPDITPEQSEAAR